MDAFTPGRMHDISTPGSTNRPAIDQSNLSRVLPRQMSTGSTRGTQTVGYGNTKIDGSNNSITVGDSILLDGNNGTITITNDDGSQIGFGVIPDSSPAEYGFFSTDTAGNLIMKIVNGTWYVYNGSYNIMQSGVLPDDTVGWAVAAPDTDVADGYS